MSFSKTVEPYTLKATADLSGLQYHILRQDGSLTCNVASNAVESSMCGVLQNKPQSGEHATVADLGISKVIAGGSLTAGDHLTCTESFRAAAAGSGDMAFGRLLSTAGADGELVSVKLYSPVRMTGAV